MYCHLCLESGRRQALSIIVLSHVSELESCCSRSSLQSCAATQVFLSRSSCNILQQVDVKRRVTACVIVCRPGVSPGQ